MRRTRCMRASAAPTSTASRRTRRCRARSFTTWATRAGTSAGWPTPSSGDARSFSLNSDREDVMNFGLIVSKQHPPGVSMVDRFREHVDQVRAARDAGFDLIVMGQHYLSTPFQEMQTLPALARLAAEAGTMGVGGTVRRRPLLNPVDGAAE